MIRTLRCGLRDLRARRLRTFLTGLSMLVGVLAVVGVSAADQLATGYVVASHEQLRGREATFAVLVEMGPDDTAALGDVMDGVVARIGPQHAAVLLVVESMISTTRPGGTLVQLDSTWLIGDLDAVYRRPLVAGAWVGPGASGAPGVVLNEAAAQVLAVSTIPATVPLGATDNPRPAVVTGIVADAAAEPRVYGQLGDAARLWPDQLSAGVATVQVTAGTHAADAVKQTVVDAATLAGLTPGDHVQRIDTVPEARGSIQVAQRAFLVTAVVALVVAGIGILNIGLASLSERARELVVRRAVGARRVDVFAQVLVGQVLVAAFVAAVAVATVLVTIYGVAPRLTPAAFIADPLTVPWRAVLNGTLVAVATSVLGAIAPAVAAARLDVADALRT
ncbi:MAG: hypothetical protein FWE61_00770 [Micrococcales bacterium]|nr:hypothetical protein [Micrococcales bacterium]